MFRYQVREYTDGGPGDRGDVLGYVKGNSVEELRKRFGIKHCFIGFTKISEKYYRTERNIARQAMYMFTNEWKPIRKRK
jgi:hypothetical protein